MPKYQHEKHDVAKVKENEYIINSVYTGIPKHS